jgi:hypothetical protein
MVWNFSLQFFHVCFLQGNLSLITWSTSFDDKPGLSLIFFKVFFNNFFRFHYLTLNCWTLSFLICFAFFLIELSLSHISDWKLVELTWVNLIFFLKNLILSFVIELLTIEHVLLNIIFKKNARMMGNPECGVVKST